MVNPFFVLFVNDGLKNKKQYKFRHYAVPSDRFENI